jgi:hypothetical protein
LQLLPEPEGTTILSRRFPTLSMKLMTSIGDIYLVESCPETAKARETVTILI